MESVIWNLRTASPFSISAPLAFSVLVLMLLCWDYLLLPPYYLLSRILRGLGLGARAGAEPPLAALVVIPTMLRRPDELESLESTIRSVANNGYPGELFVVVTIDGFSASPSLYDELQTWADREPRRAGTWLYVTGTAERRGKPMAIEQGIQFLDGLVRAGVHEGFPPVYISTDADADLGEHALERIVSRLRRRHPLTGWPARAVAGNLYIRGNNFWRGWRHFFTVEGQLSIQVAREYMCTNVARHNMRWLPLTGVPGVLYCTWSDIFRAAPRFMSYMRSLTLGDWLRWWLGWAPPAFAQCAAPAIPELIAGDTDDTVSAHLAVLARFEGGRFTLEPPRTPLHAFWALLLGLFVDRALRYEPGARVYTSSPTTIKALFKQRKRWNASRIECTGRFWRGLWFHWALGLPAMALMGLVARYCIVGGLMYWRLPMALFHDSVVTAFVFGYTFQLAGYSTLTVIALALNGELRHWRLLAALPLSPLYAICFTYAPTLVGATFDVFGFGNVTGFAPEATLKRGGSSRLALLFRLRRALMLAVRSVLVGDVPLGSFWLGWGETAWTPSGFEGWTTGKKPRPILPPPFRWAPWACGLGLVALVATAARCTTAGGSMGRPSIARVAGPEAPASVGVAGRPPPSSEVLAPVGFADLVVTSGEVKPRGPLALEITGATTRAVVGSEPRPAIEASFVYEGPSTQDIPLASGELRRQVGLKLRARDTCNVVYVMWHIEPTSGIHVAVKTSPGQSRHEECGDRGYVKVTPSEWTRDLRPIRAGERRTLSASIEGTSLRVNVDGALAWTGTLPSEAFAFDGPAGIRTDNGAFSMELRAATPR
jgi:hypothetical protein